MPAKWNMNIKTLKVIAIVLLVVIVLGAGIYWMVSGMSNKGLEGFQTATTTTTTTIPATPQSVIYPNLPKYIAYQYILDDAGALIACIASQVSNLKFPKFTIDKNILNKDSIKYLVKDTHFIVVPKSELIYLIEKPTKNSYPKDPVLYASLVDVVNNAGTFVIPGDIICKTYADIPNYIYLFNKDFFIDIPLNDRDIPVANITDNVTTGMSADIYVSKQGLIRTIATNDIIDKTVKAYPSAFYIGSSTGIYTLQKIIDQNKNQKIMTMDGQTQKMDISASISKIFAPFTNQKKTMNFIELDTLKTIQQAGDTLQKQLNNKTAKLTEAEKAINSALKEPFNNYQSGFQDTQTTTSTTQGQTLSLADKIKKLNEAKAAAEAQAKKTSNNAVKAIDDAKSAANAQIKVADNAKKAAEATVTSLQSNKDKLVAEISAAETKLDLINQKIGTSISKFQDIAPGTPPDASLSDGLTSLEAQITKLTNDQKNAETEIATLKAELETTNANLTTARQTSSKLTSLETLLQGAQFQTADSTKLASELASARSVLNNPSAQTTCPPVPACSDTSALNTQITDLMNANASLGRDIDTKAAQIINLEGKLGIATTTVNQLNEQIANFDKALTNEDRQKLTQAKNDAELSKLEIEKRLKLTEAERDMAMNNRNELRTKYEACESVKRNMPSVSTSPVYGGPMMGGRAPSYVCNPMPSRGYQVVDKHTMEVPQNSVASVPDITMQVAELLPIPPQQQEQPATSGIADNSLTAKVGFTDIPKQQLQFQNATSNPRWTYRPENYDTHNRYAAPLMHWVTGYNS